MEQPNPISRKNGDTPVSGSLVPAFPNENEVVPRHAEGELAAVRQMMELLHSRFDALQQSHAVQFAEVHERLDGVELEIPLIQEQSALRLRDIESRMNSGIEEVKAEISGKLGSLSSLFETQRQELSRVRESKQRTEDRLNRAILDIEKLCGSAGRQPAPAQATAPFRAPTPPPQPERAGLKFDDWVKQYMEIGESDAPDPEIWPAGKDIPRCPQCDSSRIRPATPIKIDAFFRLFRLSPHRCRSCAHRFYRLGKAVVPEREGSASEAAGSGATNVLEVR